MVDNKLSNNEFQKKNEEMLCIKNINAKNDVEYANELSVLPYVSEKYSVSIRKKKIEAAGFMFYIKYEIALLKEKRKKSKDNNRYTHIDEIFLYKDKINYINEIKKAEGGDNNDNGNNNNSNNNNNCSNNYNNNNNKDDGYMKNEKGKKHDDTYNDMVNDDKNSKKRKEKESLKKSSNLVKKCINNNINVYEILSVDESDDLETIKSTYKKLILIFHPDKNKGTSFLNENEKKKKREKNNKNDNNTDTKKDLVYYMEKYNIEKLTEEEKKLMFLKIQDSYTILSDKILRKQYDSSVPFDEYIPTLIELEEASNFYEFLRPVFKRNAKWSAKKPVPDIGDENTHIESVKYFYDFWYNFVNWRDFSYQNEYDYEEAECREERRWMERENKKIQKKASRAENLRIIKLVDLAYNNDPRIIAENKRIKLEKQKKKELAMLEKQKKRNDSLLINELKKDNTNTQVVSSKEKINKDNKAALKIWKHHIKSVCITKLSNLVNSDLIQEKLATLSFETLCEFIYEIYVFLNFNFQKGDVLSPIQKLNNKSSDKLNNFSYAKKSAVNNENNKIPITNSINGNLLNNIKMNNYDNEKNKLNNVKNNSDMCYIDTIDENGITSSKNVTMLKRDNDNKEENHSGFNSSSIGRDNNNKKKNDNNNFDGSDMYTHSSAQYYRDGNSGVDRTDRGISNFIIKNEEEKEEEIKDSNLSYSDKTLNNLEYKKEHPFYENDNSKTNTEEKNNNENYKYKKAVGKNNISNNTDGIYSSSKGTGFIGHLKSVELDEKNIEVLIQIFKKYIKDFNCIIKKREKVNTQEGCNLRSNIESNIYSEGMEIRNNIIKTKPDVDEKMNAVNHDSKDNYGNVEKKDGTNDEKRNNENFEKNKELDVNSKWTTNEISLLTKALKAYPGGTKNRWILITNTIKTKNVKEVLKKAKEMFENETLKNLSTKIEETPFDHFKNQNKGVMKKIDDNLDKRESKIENEEANAEEEVETEGKKLNNNINGNNNIEGKKPWTHEEQFLLEKALMKYPASIPIKERLRLVSSEIKTRSIDEVIFRMKTLRAQILAKKSAK
ncbi:DNA-binding chaperone, putative [Plasmodium malariae]|uniref:DNA-binding chaperone, putative n=1 Tax=Plasmodium malariae TaxID=5858 RepID=A0A1A8WCL4_PLAMA|nr:DNA-binding chaperone, putative [Plasmodium malariae]SBS90746.1 DNA-binding chaperone, putative [Plasmodium malariae]SCP03458.1 DNA-binding chaperone, putative [Plasmodium malariae]